MLNLSYCGIVAEKGPKAVERFQDGACVSKKLHCITLSVIVACQSGRSTARRKYSPVLPATVHPSAPQHHRLPIYKHSTLELKIFEIACILQYSPASGSNVQTFKLRVSAAPGCRQWRFRATDVSVSRTADCHVDDVHTMVFTCMDMVEAGAYGE